MNFSLATFVVIKTCLAEVTQRASAIPSLHVKLIYTVCMVRYHFICLVVACTSVALSAQAQSAVRAEGGVLDARYWNFQEQNLALTGYWAHYPNELVTPREAGAKKGQIHYLPELWNETTPDGKGLGYATYQLKVLLPDTIHQLAVEVPQLYSGYTLWANGLEIASAGVVSDRKETTTPQWVHQVGVISMDPADTLVLVLQIANFHHYKGGIKDPVMLGLSTNIHDHAFYAITASVIESAVLATLALCFFILFMVRRQRVVLYFALLCLSWGARAWFSNVYPVTAFFPSMPWAWVVRFEYLTLYSGIVWAALFLHALLENLSHQLMPYIVVVLNILFALFTLFTPALVYSQWVGLYLAVAAFVLIYAAVLAVRALMFEQAGAWYMVASIITGVAMFGYDIVAYNKGGVYDYIFLSIGYLLIFLLTTVVLLYHLNVFKSRGEKQVLTYEDFFKK